MKNSNNSKLPDKIIVPEIFSNGNIVREKKIYHIKNWINGRIKTDLDIENNGFEGEGFVINKNGEPVIYNENLFIGLPETDKDIKKVSTNPDSENNLNKEIRNFLGNGLFYEKKVNITRELYLPCIETSFNKGYNIKELFIKIIQSYKELISFIESKNLLYTPLGNMPLYTKNIPNFGNNYYKYLFETRDGLDIAYFRGAGFQLHKGIENYKLAVYTYNKIRHLLPLFLVLSENSPFVDNEYRGNLSERTSTKCDWKMTGIPDAIDNNFLNHLQDWLNSTIKSVTPYYFAVRYPRIDIKTIENCSMDMVSDILIMCTLIDLYYRITERLKIAFLEKEKLPTKLFGKDNNSFVETNVIKENFHRSIRYGTNVKYSLLGEKEYSFKEYMDNLLTFIETIPSVFPEFVSNIFNITCQDPTKKIIGNIIDNGNLAEKTLKDFSLYKKNPINPIKINKEDIKKYLIKSAKHFSEQISKIIINNQ
ncbi:hypothetical protein KAZ01_03430 [Candidatus Gracilibacteria bacterium]|nr:hypothetical protein [Candidatus Gracilibacteria bacterium]